ncbi:hypothetical protein COHA_003526 [Chlorella ohadii]|uniref:Sugar phosphate transporter domain-containing protein n=1 Tax=Chlorella ohadii TaxID=2649997 RepID=A0AAD5H752_9CHLO|nr:hypothetical protein COHA_003526 [Chlorella ohadii]
MSLISSQRSSTGDLQRTASAKQGPLTAAAAQPPSLLARLTACLQYAFLSIAITLFNRAVFSVYLFNYPSTVTLLQILVSLVLMYALRAAGTMQFGGFTLQGARKVAPLAFFWWLYVVSGVTALRYLNVPMYSVIRRSTTLLVVSGEFWMFNKRPTRRSLAALLLMVCGAVVAGITDLTFNLPGYIWVSICVVSTAAYLLLIKKLQDSTGLDQNTLLYFNNVLALPLMAGFMLLATNEAAEVARYPQLWDPHFLLFLLLSCSQAFLLNLCIFRCTLVNSPLATNVTGQMKDILTTALGMVIFQDVKYSAMNIGGILLGLAGSVTYSAVSYLESRAPSTAAAGSVKAGGAKAGGAKANKAQETPHIPLLPQKHAEHTGGSSNGSDAQPQATISAYRP